jgi:hypothetical protein
MEERETTTFIYEANGRNKVLFVGYITLELNIRSTLLARLDRFVQIGIRQSVR